MSLTDQRLSDLIGSIYDCAIDPSRWPETIEEICHELRCKCGSLMMIDYQQRQFAYAAIWNFDPKYVLDNADNFLAWWELIKTFLLTRPLDEPYATARFDYGALILGKSFSYLGQKPNHARLAKVALRHGYRHYAKIVRQFLSGEREVEKALLAGDVAPAATLSFLMELGRKANSLDTMSTIVLRDRSRVGLFNADRGAANGFADDSDLEVLRMIAPHIRRAVTISDLLSLKTVEAHTLGATLNRLALAVVIVAADGRILHTNEAADGMLAGGGPISSLQGRLHLAGEADAELAKAVKLADREGDIGKMGMAIPLAGEKADAALAHVLPLARGEVRSQLLPQAAAAIFITRPGQTSPGDLSGFAEIFRLTPAETRVLQELVRGNATMTEVANSLDISEATAKTHLSHILAKTGVGRQAALIALVRDLVPPLAVR